jgi:hypothetical protein
LKEEKKMKVTFWLMVLGAFAGFFIGMAVLFIFQNLPLLLALWLSVKGWASIGCVIGALIGIYLNR